MEWAHQDLNLGPTGYEPAALNRTELWALENASLAVSKAILPTFPKRFKSR